MTDTAAEDAVGAEGLDDRAIGELVDRARAEGVNLTGPGGLLAELAKKVLESALEGEMTDHLGYEAHDPAGRNGGNSRNGHRPKTVLTEAGPVELDCPGTATPVSTRRSCRNASAA